MRIEKILKPAFAVIGKMGSTDQGEGFIQALWAEANAHFAEVASLAKRDERGNPVGVWGAMSDFSLSFRPWENGFSRGLYLAGVECNENAEPPAGWTKWIIPGFEYLRAENDCADVFPKTLRFMEENGLSLAGAAHDFTDPATGKGYVLFPLRKL